SPQWAGGSAFLFHADRRHMVVGHAPNDATATGHHELASSRRPRPARHRHIPLRYRAGGATRSAAGMIRSQRPPVIGGPRRHRGICAGIVLLCVAALTAAAAVAQVPSDLLKREGPVADQEPITPLPAPPAADPLKLALGERLFFDPRLSSTGTLACSSCHDIRTNGARPSTATVSRPFDPLTIFNAVLSFRLNWQGNFRSPAAQLVSSLENPVNMRSSVDDVVRKLKADPGIVNQFRNAYGGEPNGERFVDAMVTFERS